MLDYFGKLNKNVINQIKYRGTILTGEITKDNGDGTYDVKIAQADKAYPNVETAFYDETFSVTEIVIVTFEDGNKERPRIWGHAKKIAQEPKIVEVDYSGGARVETLNAYSITATTAYVNGKISIIGVIGNCTRRGFHYGTTIDYGSDVYEDGSFGEGTYNLQITGLTAEETYHYQAFVLDANGDEQVGEDKTFITAISKNNYALIVTTPDEIQSFDSNGDLLKKVSVSGWAYSACDITLDSQGNIYTETNWNKLTKYDKDGNLLVTQEIESGNNWFESINFGNDGYLYTFEGRAAGYAIAKRDTTDLTIIEDVKKIYGSYSGGMCLDSDGNFYVYNGGSIDEIEKYNSAGVKVASLYVGYINEYAGFGVCGDNLYIAGPSKKIYYMPLDLSGYTEWVLPSSIAYALTVADGHLILSGWDGDGDGATSKYDSGRNLVWTKKLTAASYAYKAGGYNF